MIFIFQAGQKLYTHCHRAVITTDHHLFYNGVTAQDVVFPWVVLDMVLHPCSLP